MNVWKDLSVGMFTAVLFITGKKRKQAECSAVKTGEINYARLVGSHGNHIRSGGGEEKQAFHSLLVETN